MLDTRLLEKGKLTLPLPDDAIVLVGPGSLRFRESAELTLKSSAPVVELKRFRDGETSVKVPANVRNKDVYLVQSLEPPANESLMELCLTLDALKKASATRITVIIPYMAYARADRRMEGREAIGAQLVARFIEMSGADRAVILDLHSEQVQGFFRVPVDNVYGTNIIMPEVLRYLRKQNLNPSEIVVVSPDAGGAKRARAVAKSLGARFALIDKMRPRANEVAEMVLLGEVKGSACLIVDDMVDTANTIVEGAALLVKNGASRVLAACTHPLLSGEAQSKIAGSSIEKFFVTDSVRLPALTTDKIEVVALGGFIGDLIQRECFGESMLDLRTHNHQKSAAE